MESGNQRLELCSAEKLNLIEQQDDASPSRLCRLTDRYDKVSEVSPKVTSVSETWPGLDIKSSSKSPIGIDP
jgi:hypothetical protein